MDQRNSISQEHSASCHRGRGWPRGQGRSRGRRWSSNKNKYDHLNTTSIPENEHSESRDGRLKPVTNEHISLRSRTHYSDSNKINSVDDVFEVIDRLINENKKLMKSLNIKVKDLKEDKNRDLIDILNAPQLLRFESKEISNQCALNLRKMKEISFAEFIPLIKSYINDNEHTDDELQHSEETIIQALLKLIDVYEIGFFGFYISEDNFEFYKTCITLVREIYPLFDLISNKLNSNQKSLAQFEKKILILKGDSIRFLSSALYIILTGINSISELFNPYGPNYLKSIFKFDFFSNSTTGETIDYRKSIKLAIDFLISIRLKNYYQTKMIFDELNISINSGKILDNIPINNIFANIISSNIWSTPHNIVSKESKISVSDIFFNQISKSYHTFPISLIKTYGIKLDVKSEESYLKLR